MTNMNTKDDNSESEPVADSSPLSHNLTDMLRVKRQSTEYHTVKQWIAYQTMPAAWSRPRQGIAQINLP